MGMEREIKSRSGRECYGVPAKGWSGGEKGRETGRSASNNKLITFCNATVGWVVC